MLVLIVGGAACMWNQVCVITVCVVDDRYYLVNTPLRRVQNFLVQRTVRIRGNHGERDGLQ